MGCNARAATIVLPVLTALLSNGCAWYTEQLQGTPDRELLASSGETTVARPRPGEPVEGRLVVETLAQRIKKQGGLDLLEINQADVEGKAIQVSLKMTGRRAACFEIEDYVSNAKVMFNSHPYKKVGMKLVTSDGLSLDAVERKDMRYDGVGIEVLVRGDEESNFQPTTGKLGFEHSFVTACFRSTKRDIIRPDTRWVGLEIGAPSNRLTFVLGGPGSTGGSVSSASPTPSDEAEARRRFREIPRRAEPVESPAASHGAAGNYAGDAETTILSGPHEGETSRVKSELSIAEEGGGRYRLIVDPGAPTECSVPGKREGTGFALEKGTICRAGGGLKLEVLRGTVDLFAAGVVVKMDVQVRPEKPQKKLQPFKMRFEVQARRQ